MAKKQLKPIALAASAGPVVPPTLSPTPLKILLNGVTDEKKNKLKIRPRTPMVNTIVVSGTDFNAAQIGFLLICPGVSFSEFIVDNANATDTLFTGSFKAVGPKTDPKIRDLEIVAFNDAGATNTSVKLDFKRLHVI